MFVVVLVSRIFFIFLVIIIYTQFNISRCFRCSWCFLCSMYRYYQTLTLKRHPPGLPGCRLVYHFPPGVLFSVTPAPGSSVFFGFHHIAPLKSIKKVSPRSFCSIPGRNKAIFCLVRRFLPLGGVLYPKMIKSPQRGFLGFIRAYCFIGVE